MTAAPIVMNVMMLLTSALWGGAGLPLRGASLLLSARTGTAVAVTGAELELAAGAESSDNLCSTHSRIFITLKY